jgi:hypothetical protein
MLTFRLVRFMVRFIGRIILSPRATALRTWRGIFVWWRVMRDSRTPTLAKVLFWLGPLWALKPFDPLGIEQPLGWIVDGLLVVGPIVLAVKIVPLIVVSDAREAVAKRSDPR